MRKPGERLMIGDSIVVKIVEIQGKRVTVGIEAPKNILVDREEIFNKRREEQGLPPVQSSRIKE